MWRLQWIRGSIFRPILLWRLLGQHWRYPLPLSPICAVSWKQQGMFENLSWKLAKPRRDCLRHSPIAVYRPPLIVTLLKWSPRYGLRKRAQVGSWKHRFFWQEEIRTQIWLFRGSHGKGRVGTLVWIYGQHHEKSEIVKRASHTATIVHARITGA